jgi:hypothetical protein
VLCACFIREGLRRINHYGWPASVLATSSARRWFIDDCADVACVVLVVDAVLYAVFDAALLWGETSGPRPIFASL